MPRYEYTDHEGGQHVITASTASLAMMCAAQQEFARTASWHLSVRAAGTVELSDERSRAA